MPRTTRKKISSNLKGIYADNHGFAVVVTYKGRRKEKHFRKGTSLRTLKDSRAKLLHDLKLKVPAAGTFRADALAYLASLPENHYKENRSYELRPWYRFIGALSRTQVTPELLSHALAEINAPPSTTRKYLTAIQAVWRYHDGRLAPSPADHIRRPREQHEIRDVPRAVVTMILRKLRPSKTRARLKVLARTGLPHAQIAAIEPHHLDLEKRELTVTPRRKGKGVPARTIPITFAAVRAFKEFQRMNAWGSFSRHSMRKIFLEAVTAAKASWQGRWPARENLRPYDLRHAFLTEAYKRSRDLRATAELGLHADLAMTARYAAAAVSDTAQAARDAIDQRSATRRATNSRHKATVHARKSRSGTAKKRGTSRGKSRAL